jgi:hypothetical protein
VDRPIIESPYFGPIQWRQSLSHMPRAVPEPAPQLQPEPEPAPEPEPMDIPEMAAEHEMAVEPDREAEQEEQPEEEDECITLRLFTLPGHPRGHTIPDQGRTISVCRFSEGCSSGQTRGPGDVPSHLGLTSSSIRTFCSTTNPVTSL